MSFEMTVDVERSLDRCVGGGRDPFVSGRVGMVAVVREVVRFVVGVVGPLERGADIDVAGTGRRLRLI